MVMTTNATAAPARTAARRYSEQVHFLTDEQTRAYTLGVAMLAAERGGYARPKEGEEVRDLIDEAIAARYKKDPKGYAAAVERGQQVLAEKRAEAERRRASTSGMVDAVASPTA
jgi:hypothetical protein